jgi:NAD(P)-dependent dehydrogenase (short-subunit alcohol dehydrogenase family)
LQSNSYDVGGANGIGAATVEKLCNAGAKVVFGDYDGAAGQRTAETLSNSKHAPMFVTMDVSKYEDNIKLFRTAFDKYQRVDHALAIAGIVEKGKWFDPALTIESVEQPETLQVMNINFVGVAYFTRIARVYLKHGMEQGEDKSIVLISSAAGTSHPSAHLSYRTTNNF